MTNITEAFRRFDEENSRDPNKVEHNGEMVAKEILYARRMTACLDNYCPDAPIEVRLAARSQHICRWHIPRDKYPMDRAGYHKWRKELSGYHADLAGNVLKETGFSNDVVEKVQALLRKDNLKNDPNAQLLEDVICLVFLEFYFGDFAAAHDEAKVVDIVRKTWKKMSDNGHAAAQEMSLSTRSQELIQKALG